MRWSLIWRLVVGVLAFIVIATILSRWWAQTLRVTIVFAGIAAATWWLAHRVVRVVALSRRATTFGAWFRLSPITLHLSAYGPALLVGLVAMYFAAEPARKVCADACTIVASPSIFLGWLNAVFVEPLILLWDDAWKTIGNRLAAILPVEGRAATRVAGPVLIEIWPVLAALAFARFVIVSRWLDTRSRIEAHFPVRRPAATPTDRPTGGTGGSRVAAEA